MNYQLNAIFITMSKIKLLELKKLITEYDYLLIDEEIKNEVITEFKPLFMDEVSEKIKKFGGEEEEQKTEEEQKNEQLENNGENEIDLDKNKENKKIKKVLNDDELSPELKEQIKKLYREIVKKTHPDKVNSEELINIYIASKDAYEKNDVLTLLYYAVKLDIDFEFGDELFNIINKLIIQKKQNLKDFETSWIWLWYKAENKKEKDNIITLYYLKKYKNLDI